MAHQTMIYLMKMWSVSVLMIVSGLPNQAQPSNEMINVTVAE